MNQKMSSDQFSRRPLLYADLQISTAERIGLASSCAIDTYDSRLTSLSQKGQILIQSNPIYVVSRHHTVMVSIDLTYLLYN